MQAENEKYMRKAIALSLKNIETGNGGPFGALIVKEGEIIAEAANEVTSTNDPTAHAEIVAIREACQRLGTYSLEDCVLYASCEPCPMCLAAIYWARIKSVYFASGREEAAEAGFDDAFLYQEIPRPLEERKLPLIKIPLDEARQVFRRWKEVENKEEY